MTKDQKKKIIKIVEEQIEILQSVVDDMENEQYDDAAGTFWDADQQTAKIWQLFHEAGLA